MLFQFVELFLFRVDFRKISWCGKRELSSRALSTELSTRTQTGQLCYSCSCRVLPLCVEFKQRYHLSKDKLHIAQNISCALCSEDSNCHLNFVKTFSCLSCRSVSLISFRFMEMRLTLSQR